MFRILGHLALFAGLYIAAAMVCFAQLAGLGFDTLGSIHWDAVVWTLLTGTGIYALDRVKLRTAWIDPSDIHGQPSRYAYLQPRAAAVRVFALAALILGTLAGLSVTSWAALAGMVGAVGVVVYAPGPRRGHSRLKDLPVLKNVYIAAGISGFAALAALAAAAPRGHISEVWTAATGSAAIPIAAALLAARIAIDAAICDLDDEHADRRFGTRTLPVQLGARRAWVYTGIARTLLAAVTLAARPCPFRARLVWAVVGTAGIAALRLRRPERVRDPVDLRMTVEAVVATAALLAWNHLAR